VLSEDQSLYRNINYLASYPPYIFSWIGTVLLLRHFYQRIGKLPVRYWIILTIPLILYLIGSGLIFSLPSDMPYLYYFRILFRAGTIASSILFGLAFYIITRNVNAGKVKDYFAITAIGITIIGIANETSITSNIWSSCSFFSTAIFISLHYRFVLCCISNITG